MQRTLAKVVPGTEENDDFFSGSAAVSLTYTSKEGMICLLLKNSDKRRRKVK